MNVIIFKIKISNKLQTCKFLENYFLLDKKTFLYFKLIYQTCHINFQTIFLSGKTFFPIKTLPNMLLVSDWFGARFEP